VGFEGVGGGRGTGGGCHLLNQRDSIFNKFSIFDGIVPVKSFIAKFKSVTTKQRDNGGRKIWLVRANNIVHLSSSK
jgi:hypothetical protein